MRLNFSLNFVIFANVHAYYLSHLHACWAFCMVTPERLKSRFIWIEPYHFASVPDTRCHNSF